MITKIKEIMRKLTHKQALILFWSCVGIFLFGPLLSMSLAYLDPVKFEPFVNHDIFFVLGVASFICMFPVLFLIPLIGSGFFHRKHIA